jgi:site-specific recombinase XerD
VIINPVIEITKLYIRANEIMTQPYKSPKPLFDTLEHVCTLYKQSQSDLSGNLIESWLKNCLGDYYNNLPEGALKEYNYTLMFLYSYRGSADTFNSYRREIERFLQWSWFVHQKPILSLKRLDIEAFIEFCQKPLKSWIGTKIVSRFTTVSGERTPHPQWRPFIVKVSKKDFQDGERPQKTDFRLSSEGIKQIFAVLGTFYNALIQEEATEINPILQIRQKSKFIQKKASAPIIRRISNAQWQAVLESTQEMALKQPEIHKRTLFIMQCLYGLYLRISELAASSRWTPKMSDFFRDQDNNWWFRTVGKGNKLRQIAVSKQMLEALKAYREYLGYTPLPTPDDKNPLIPKARGKGPISSTNVIRKLVQQCFDVAVEKLNEKGQKEEANMLRSATVHWLRHTGISEDVKVRPREHVRDDAGHSSSAITDRYIDVELQARAQSAKNKSLK